MKNYILTTALLLGFVAALTAETMPAKPDKYFNDYAGIVSPEQAHTFNEKLAQFERDTSNQFIVAVYPNMETESSIEDYAQRIMHTWKLGQADKNNGVLLLVFMKSPGAGGQMRIQTGYGLEGALPDATGKQILHYKVRPYFKNKDFVMGLQNGINAVIAETQKEYKGTGKTDREAPSQIVKKDDGGNSMGGVIFFVILFGIGLISGIVALILHFKNKKQREREEAEERERDEQERIRASMIPIAPVRVSRKREKVQARRSGGFIPIPVPIPIPEPARHDDDEEESRSSSSSESDSSSESSDSGFSSGGGDSGGGGASDDF